MSYQHLSKAGSRFLKQFDKRPKHLLQHFEKYEKKAMPEFLKPSLPRVDEDSKFKSETEWMFLPGDRVVIMKGELKGQIACIHQHDKETNGYILDENGPTKTVPVPKQFWQEGQTSHITSFPIPLQQDDLKLVADIEDSNKPGEFKTVAVRNIVFRDRYFDKNYKKFMPYRCVAGQEDLVIPWPKPEYQEDRELATNSQIAREQTFWFESIVKSPIPQAALLTIRNPYSKYKRGTLTSRDIAKLVEPKMPLTETKKAFISERKRLAEQSKQIKLSDDDKEKIGAAIYQHFKGSV